MFEDDADGVVDLRDVDELDDVGVAESFVDLILPPNVPQVVGLVASAGQEVLDVAQLDGHRDVGL